MKPYSISSLSSSWGLKNIEISPASLFSPTKQCEQCTKRVSMIGTLIEMPGFQSFPPNLLARLFAICKTLLNHVTRWLIMGGYENGLQLHICCWINASFMDSSFAVCLFVLLFAVPCLNCLHYKMPNICEMPNMWQSLWLCATEHNVFRIWGILLMPICVFFLKHLKTFESF